LEELLNIKKDKIEKNEAAIKIQRALIKSKLPKIISKSRQSPIISARKYSEPVEEFKMTVEDIPQSKKRDYIREGYKKGVALENIMDLLQSRKQYALKKIKNYAKKATPSKKS